MEGKLRTHLVENSVLLFEHASGSDSVSLFAPVNIPAMGRRGTVDSLPGVIVSVVVEEHFDDYVPFPDLATSSCKGFCAFVEAAHGSVIDVELHVSYLVCFYSD